MLLIGIEDGGSTVTSETSIASLLKVLRGCTAKAMPAIAFFSALNSFSSRCSLASRLVSGANVEEVGVAERKGMLEKYRPLLEEANTLLEEKNTADKMEKLVMNTGDATIKEKSVAVKEAGQNVATNL